MASEGEALQRDRHGFQVRAPGVTRLDAFVDAAFAFSVTMMVISAGKIPESIPELIQALKEIPAFAVCFAMIAMFWSAHASWSRRYGLEDGWSKVLSLLLVFLVLVYIYPLRLQFGMFFSWISGGWLPSPLQSSTNQVNVAFELGFMFIIYGVAFFTMSLCMLGLYWHAWRQRMAIGLEREEAAGTLAEASMFAMFAVTSLLSIGLASTFIFKPSLLFMSIPAGFAYSLLGFTGVVVHKVGMLAQRCLADTPLTAS